MPDFKRTILITGGTDGIGKETACVLAKNPDNFIIIHGRNKERCQAAIEAAKKRSGRSDDAFAVAIGDFADMKQVKSLAEDLITRFPKLNVVLANAGVLMANREETVHKLEMTFQVNHLAHFLLVNKLVPVLTKNGNARVVIVSSLCHSWHPIDFEDLQLSKKYEKYVQYSRSKLLNLMFGLALERRLEKTDVTVNVLEPGVIDTKLLGVGGFSGAPLSEGVIATVMLCQSEKVEGVGGKYFDSRGHHAQPSVYATKQAEQEKVWEVSEKLCRDLGVW